MLLVSQRVFSTSWGNLTSTGLASDMAPAERAGRCEHPVGERYPFPEQRTYNSG